MFIFHNLSWLPTDNDIINGFILLSVPLRHDYVKLIQYEQYWAPRVSFILLLKAFEILTCLSLKMPMTLGAALDYLCCWRETLGGTEGLFVLPSSYESWFWLAKEPARISPLWCDGPGTLHPHANLLETPTSLTQYG